MAVLLFMVRIHCLGSESPHLADSVEKYPFADAEFGPMTEPQALLSSVYSRLLRCRKDLGQFPEVLGDCGEEEFVNRSAGAT